MLKLIKEQGNGASVPIFIKSQGSTSSLLILKKMEAAFKFLFAFGIFIFCLVVIGFFILLIKFLLLFTDHIQIMGVIMTSS
ncbi:hypothetical protein HGA34_01315 [Candidatus Falkowbacteria bacterium]|nr:hypothetical protein [Candidatus Falkowbacteria bacterium]